VAGGAPATLSRILYKMYARPASERTSRRSSCSPGDTLRRAENIDMTPRAECTENCPARRGGLLHRRRRSPRAVRLISLFGGHSRHPAAARFYVVVHSCRPAQAAGGSGRRGHGRRTTSAVTAGRRVVRRGLMQGRQESRQGIGCLGTASRRGAVSRFTGDPGCDNPRARERSEGRPRRCGTGIRKGRRGAMGGSEVCSLRSSSSAS
jgi:hypothetical protein